MLGGLALFWRSHIDLGQHWSRQLTVWSDHALVSSGLYSRVRHPMYLAMLVIAAGQDLLRGNSLAGWAGLASRCRGDRARMAAAGQEQSLRRGTEAAVSAAAIQQRRSDTRYPGNRRAFDGGDIPCALVDKRCTGKAMSV
jgi:hypothetical protein